MSKKTLGQYFTTNYEYILKNLDVDYSSGVIIEAFHPRKRISFDLVYKICNYILSNEM